VLSFNERRAHYCVSIEGRKRDAGVRSLPALLVTAAAREERL